MSAPLMISTAAGSPHALPSDLFARFASSSSFTAGCALTILRGSAEQPISAHTPISSKAEMSSDTTARPRFATSFAKPISKPALVDASLNVHAVSDSGILLPFLDRPTEVHELLFLTKTNEYLVTRLCRIFGGDVENPTQRGTDERWDEMLQLLVDTDRPILDDEDWLIRIESLVIERSPELWAQLSRCLGADGLTCTGPNQSSQSRFDSWAPSSRHVSSASESSVLADEDMSDDLDVNVQALEDVPVTFCKQPAGKMQQSSLHDVVSPPLSAQMDGEGPLSPSLDDIMEEPGKPGQSQIVRRRSQSGRFAALRISAMTPSSPTSSRRSSEVSLSRSASISKDRSISPMHADPLPSSDADLGSALDNYDAPASPAAFSRHRRLSTMIVHSQQEAQKQTSQSAHASPRPEGSRRLRGVSEVGLPLTAPSSPAPPMGRRRADSFARSFAGLTPSGLLPKVPLVDGTVEAASPTAPTAEKTDPTPGRKRGDSTSSSNSSSSPPIIGLLADGRTRHPSGSLGSKDLTESVAAFRATMGLSSSPTPPAPNLDDRETLGKPAEVTTRKRKGTGAERPQFTSLTSSSESKISTEAKVSRTQPSMAPKADVDQPRHMQKLDSKQKTASGGSGLALGGGFSLAKSGANFRKQSDDQLSSSRSTAAGDFSFRSPPAVQRRPGGFESIANEYDFARRARRPTTESVFSINSNALGTSPSSSTTSRASLEDSPERAPVSEKATAELSATMQDKPAINASSGVVTPRASFSGTTDGYPFPASAPSKSFGSSPSSSTQVGSNLLGLKSPTIVFPIAPNPSISRARELQKTLESNACREAFAEITKVADAADVQVIREMISNTERTHMSDEALLEAIAQKVGLVDHERAHLIGGKPAHDADVILAEEGYDQRWYAFASLCRALGVGQYEISAAKRRCGPAIDLSGH